MDHDRRLDLVCVSYLASTRLLRVPAYPQANSGAVVASIGATIGADGPMAAALGSQIGLRTGLVANSVGSDHAGRQLLGWLSELRVRHDIAAVPDKATPELTVVVDEAGTRTWFASLYHAVAELHVVNLHMMSDARLVYIDCYRALSDVAVRTIKAAQDTPLLINLDAGLPDDQIVTALKGHPITAVQASLDEADACNAPPLAEALFRSIHTEAAIVTIGRLGAVAFTAAGLCTVPAPPVAVTSTHGAGAAFSAGFAKAVLAGATTEMALRAGCELGAAHCGSKAADIPRRFPSEAFDAA